MTWRTILMEKDGVQPSVCLRNCELLDHVQVSSVMDHFSRNKTGPNICRCQPIRKRSPAIVHSSNVSRYLASLYAQHPTFLTVWSIDLRNPLALSQTHCTQMR